MLTIPTRLLAPKPTALAPRPAPRFWRDILRDAGYPLEVVVLDFETYFDTDYKITSIPTVEFIADPRFEVLGLGVLPMCQPFDDYEQRAQFWHHEEQVLMILNSLRVDYGSQLEGCTVVAQNANFDLSILAMRYDLHPKYVIDILGLARHWESRTSNDLDTLAKRYKLVEKGDTSEFRGFSFKLRSKKGKRKGPPVRVPPMSDEKALALSKYACNDLMREWEVFKILLPKLSTPSFELRVMQHTLELFTRPTLAVDTVKAEELKQAMEAEVDRECTSAGLTIEQISGNISFEEAILTALVEAGDAPSRYFKPVKGGGSKLAEAKDDPERAELLAHPNDRVRTLMLARNAVKSWPLHIARVDRIVGQAAARGGLLPLSLKYHGAHTGRWAGGEKINPQNLGSKSHPLINAIREIIVAPPGKELVIVDSSQIEARVLSWLAGQDDLTEKFRLNEEIYCDFATKVLGWPVRKPRKVGIPEIEARHKWARNSIGKVGVLGCGYGMGKARMVEQNGDLTLDLAERIVETYRRENDKIVQFWKDIERAFAYTAKYGRPCELPRGLRFDKTDDCDCIITLPCGRELKYHQVKLVPNQYGGDTIEVWNDQEKHWGHVWGGHLTENVVQAISRDILIEAILALEEIGLHTAHHVHDELILVVDQEQGATALPTAIEYLSRVPAWGPGLPLAAEGCVSARYGGH